MAVRVLALVLAGSIVLLTGCSSTHKVDPLAVLSSINKAPGPAPAYSLAQAKRFLVTPAEAGFPRWKVRVPDGEQSSQTTLALEYLSRTPLSPATTASLEVSHSAAITRQARALAAPMDTEDLSHARSMPITLRGGVTGTEISGYDTELRRQQVTVVALVGPTTVTVIGQNRTTVEQVAAAQVEKVPSAP